MYVKELDWDSIISFCNANTSYNSRPWWIYLLPRLKRQIERTQGRREVFDYVARDQNPSDYAANDIDVMLEFNHYKYDHLWKLYEAEYNPLWNVDGTEKTVTETDMTDAHTGTQTNEASGTDYRTRTNTGTQTVENSGTDSRTVTNTGTQTTEDSGTDTLTHGLATTTSATTYDSSTLLTTGKSENSGDDETTYGKTEERTDDLTEQDDFTHGHTEERTDDLTEQDNTTYGKTDERTDDLTDRTTGTVTITHTRGGNIGLTMTQQMATEEEKWSNHFKFVNNFILDIVSCISYNFM